MLILERMYDSDNESSEDSGDDRTESARHKISRADMLSLYRKSPLRCSESELSENSETWLVSGSELSKNPETWLVNEVSKEVLKSSSSELLSLQTKSLPHGADQLDNISVNTFERRQDSPESSTNPPKQYCSFTFF